MEAILSAAVTGALSILGVMISNNMANQKMAAQLEKAQAVTDTQLKELTREVREHNNFAKRVPVLESQFKEIDKKVQELAQYHKQPVS